MAEKKFSDIMKELNDISNHLKDNGISIEDALTEFTKGAALIDSAKEQLTKIEKDIKKVLDDDTTTNFDL